MLTGERAGKRFALGEGQSILGRSHDVDLQVDAPDVSRRHLKIEREGQSIRIVDLNSTNGTRVNGEPVTSATLRNGDELLVGTQALRLVIEP
ncbi:MAG: FHA domain-containing protein [Thermomicrobiales bacterium]|jgi:pSer/pThr/pTyr-binding forkhead associated (FHA) protein